MKRWWWRLARYGRPYWRTLIIVVLFMLAAVAMEALRPWPMKLIVDNVLTGEPLPNTIAWLTLLPGADTQAGLLAWLALATVFVFLASRSADLASGYLQVGIGNRMAYDLGADLLDHLQRLSLSHTNKRSTGDLVRRVATDSRAVRDLVAGGVLGGIAGTVVFLPQICLPPCLPFFCTGMRCAASGTAAEAALKNLLQERPGARASGLP